MIQTIQLTPGVVLRHYPDQRFKTAVISVQLLRPMCREEAALNALLSAVLLRGSRNHPDMRAITVRQDELYGAALPPLLRLCVKGITQQNQHITINQRIVHRTTGNNNDAKYREQKDYDRCQQVHNIMQIRKRQFCRILIFSS